MPIVRQDGPSLFDGRACTLCGFWKLLGDFPPRKRSSDGHSSWCIACFKTYRQAHYIANRDRYNAASHTRYYANIEQRREEGRLRYARNPARMKAYQKRYAAANPQKERDWKSKWSRNNPAKVRITTLRRIARKHGAEGSYTLDQWNEMLACFGHECLACGADRGITIDHVVALARGGRDSIENLQPLCHPCNARKGVRPLDYREPAALASLLAALGARDGP